jgi:predicted PurR-regulated permease PerM
VEGKPETKERTAPGDTDDRTPAVTPDLLRRSAIVCGQLLVVLVTLWVLLRVVTALTVVVIPLAIALLLAALFAPLVAWLSRRGLPRAAATAVVLLGGLAAVGGLLWFVIRAIVTGLPDLRTRLNDSYTQLRDWLSTGPLGLSGDELDRMLTQGRDWVSRNQQNLVSGAFGVFSTLGAVLAGLAMALFILIFFVHDGRRMWNSLLRPVPERARDKAERAGARAFHDLGAFVRATIAVALIDAVGIGLGLWITGVPLVIPLAALVFLGAFVPLVGAFVSGLAAALVALVSQGPLIALIVVAIVIVVQQLEGNVLEPLITSNAVKLHPVAVLLAVAIGVTQAGIAGALLAVPLLTTIRAIVSTYLPTQS